MVAANLRTQSDSFKYADGLTLLSVARMSEEEAEAALCEIRWGRAGGIPWCPECGCAKSYRLGYRKFWKCAECRLNFSVTSRTFIDRMKLPKHKLLLAAVLFTNTTKGVSSLDMARHLSCQGKTAFILLHRFREAMSKAQDALRLSGTVEVDGAQFGGHRSPFVHYLKDGKRRYKFHYKQQKTLVVARQSDRKKTAVFVGNKESQSALWLRARASGATALHVDGAHAWDGLKDLAVLMRVNHTAAIYKSDDGACTNNAESFFSMMRRQQLGVHHRLSAKFLSRYAGEMAWRQDMRLLKPSSRAFLLLQMLLLPGRSEFSGYSHRRRSSAAAEIVSFPVGRGRRAA